MWSTESRNTRPQGAERADARRGAPWHRRVVAAFLSVALVAGVAPWDARAFAENVSGGGVF